MPGRNETLIQISTGSRTHPISQRVEPTSDGNELPNLEENTSADSMLAEPPTPAGGLAGVVRTDSFSRTRPEGSEDIFMDDEEAEDGDDEDSVVTQIRYQRGGVSQEPAEGREKSPDADMLMLD